MALATGDAVVLLDGDLQDPPELIPAFYEKWREGNDVVYGRRVKRGGSRLLALCCKAFYRVFRRVSYVPMPLDAGDFSLMDRKVVRELLSLPETDQFVRGLRAWVGFRQTGVAYDRPERQAGRTKYTLRRLYRLATDGVASSSVRPLQLAQVFSFSYFVLMFVLGAVILRRLLLSDSSGVPASVLTTYLLIVSGSFVQSLCLYILGAYVGRTYIEVKRRPPYVVMETIAPPREAHDR
jgi:dolichol-phosphate mannosyltransferase